MSDNEIIRSKDLLMVVVLLKKLIYAIGAYNSYSVGLFKMIEESFFGLVIYVDEDKNLQILPNNSSQKGGQLDYLEQIKIIAEQFSKTTIEELNQKISFLEEIMNKEIPELKVMYLEESTPLKLAKQGMNELSSEVSFENENIFPRIFAYKRTEPNNSPLNIKNVDNICYPKASELLFVQTRDASIIIVDIIQRKICFKFTNWPFFIDKFLIKRNLNYFKVVDPNRNRFLTINDLKKNTDGRINKSENLMLSDVMLEEDLRDNLFSVEMIKNYFENLEDKIWFYKDGIVDSYLFVANDPKTGEIYFMNLKNRPSLIKEKQNARIFNREYSLSDLKKYSKELKKKKLEKNKSYSR
jgi:hypothetical protein